jgi:hypothetical protein
MATLTAPTVKQESMVSIPTALKKSNLKTKPKTFGSIKAWASATGPVNPVPEFFKKCIGKNRFFSACTEGNEMYQVKVTYDKLNTHHGFIHATMSLRSTINNHTDEYLFHVTVTLDKDDCWKPKGNGFKVCVHNDNKHDYAEDMLMFLKSNASAFKGNVRKYLYGDKMVNNTEKHKNLMGCLLKNGFAQFYSAATQQKKENG